MWLLAPVRSERYFQFLKFGSPLDYVSETFDVYLRTLFISEVVIFAYFQFTLILENVVIFSQF